MPNIEALEQLRRVVLAAPEEKFKMSSYQCGTTRCAAGWAALDPWHQTNTKINSVLPVVIRPDGQATLGQVDSDEVAETLAEVYGLGEDDTQALFYPDDNLTRKQVVASIECIIAGDGAIVYGYDEEDE